MPVAVELSQAEQKEFQRSHRWGAAIKAGLVAGLILLLFPSGNPWTSFSRPSAAHIMGRPVSSDPTVTLLSASAIPAHTAHLAVSVVYGLIILAVVYRLRSGRAILAGIVTALVLYGVNFAAFRMFAPEFTGRHEINVVIAHVLFGGIAAGVIRGMLRPPMGLDHSQPNPGARMSEPRPADAASPANSSLSNQGTNTRPLDR
jgi:hypothetical protein